MFSQKPMTIGSWWLYYLIMIIPIVNIIVFIYILLSDNANPSLKSFLWASILPLIIIIVLFFALGMSSLFLDAV